MHRLALLHLIYPKIFDEIILIFVFLRNRHWNGAFNILPKVEGFQLSIDTFLLVCKIRLPLKGLYIYRNTLFKRYDADESWQTKGMRKRENKVNRRNKEMSKPFTRIQITCKILLGRFGWRLPANGWKVGGSGSPENSATQVVVNTNKSSSESGENCKIDSEWLL